MFADSSMSGFSGVVPLFPLPNLVFFPGTALPLHIFEPRYRQMLLDVYRGEKLIGMVLLKDGWDKDYFQTPPIHQVTCLGKLTRVERLPSGRFNIQLFGLRRARIEQEVDSSKPYRLARVSLLRDQQDEFAQVRSAALLQEAFGTFNRVLRKYSEFPGEFVIRHGELPVGLLIDVLAHHTPLQPEVKQSFLEEVDVFARGRLVIDALDELLQDPENADIKRELNVFPKPSLN